MSVVWAVLSFLLGLILAPAVGDMFSEEIRNRLDELPFALLRRAARRLPPDIRSDIYELEWLPELHYILRGNQSLPITRLVHGCRFAWGLWRSASRISAEIKGVRTRPSVEPARWLRSVAGVDERLLDWAPHERTRYTMLGAVILNTALIGGVSMAVAINLTMSVPWWVTALLGFLWGFVSLSLERWLIASTHGERRRVSRFALLFPRLVMSLIMAVVIIEPLVLWIYRPSIDEEMAQRRSAHLAEYEQRLTLCNPVDATPEAVNFGCADYRLLVAPDQIPTAIAANLAEARASTASAGLLDRIEAFDALSDRQPMITVSAWTLRMFLLALTVLPIMVRLVGGVHRLRPDADPGTTAG